MDTLLKLIVSGYILGFTCMAYLLVRSWMFDEVNEGGSRQSQANAKSANWFSMALFSTGVWYVWSLIGVGMHFLLQTDKFFMQMSFFFALAISMLIFSMSTTKKTGKFAVNIMLVAGLGALAPLAF